jgi:hypothetical protein
VKPEAPLPLTPDQERARAAVRELPAPVVDAAFRARLKQDFASGRIGEAPARVLAPAWGWSTWLRWSAVPVTAAILVVAVVTLNQAPRWRVAEVTGDGVAEVDGRPIPLGTPAAFERSLGPGAHVRLPQGTSVTLASAGRMLIELTPGTEMTLPRAPGRWFGRRVLAALAGGEVHVTTGPAFRGGYLAIETAEARVEVTGTTFAVLCLPVGTCVCVYEGTVRVGGRHGALVPVTAGRRRELFNDGTPPLDDAMLPHEHGNLERLVAQRGTLLR